MRSATDLDIQRFSFFVGYKADFLVVAYVDIQGKKRLSFSFFAPKLAHEWAQTVGAKTE